MTKQTEYFESGKELISGIRSLNRSKSNEVPKNITGDDEPCYWQRKEWIDWILSVADAAEKDIKLQSQRIADLERQVAHNQSVIDRLMLEYCPNEMTDDQLDRWGKHQVTVNPNEQLFYLQDKRQYVGNDMLWWAKDGKGYTTDVSKAHVFTKEKALSQHNCRPDIDIPWPKDYVDKHTRPAVDMWYVDIQIALHDVGVNLIKPPKPKRDTQTKG